MHHKCISYASLELRHGFKLLRIIVVLMIMIIVIVTVIVLVLVIVMINIFGTQAWLQT